MRLESRNGNSVVLRLDGYQFPEMESSEDSDPHDLNWLFVIGDVVHGDRSWSFRAPCLVTWEARAIADWLRSVADGSRQPEPVVDAERAAPGLLGFIEPNLAFNLHDRSADAATIRLYLSHGSAPPRPDGEPQLFGPFVPLSMTAEAISSAVEEWDAELASFPQRT